ncbi:hypothetical protein Hypma_003950 [Hypsizygus marmoreus]|uniref:Uncharacterized protein n=1 Tax=Hypsizygus marmoreus TaxID=39966 RepID=A0A369J8A2_HYPMA|nr:hypothetical protein Hypma_003950 [Hypsizygus marmoreus]
MYIIYPRLSLHIRIKSPITLLPTIAHHDSIQDAGITQIFTHLPTMKPAAGSVCGYVRIRNNYGCGGVQGCKFTRLVGSGFEVRLGDIQWAPMTRRNSHVYLFLEDGGGDSLIHVGEREVVYWNDVPLNPDCSRSKDASPGSRRMGIALLRTALYCSSRKVQALRRVSSGVAQRVLVGGRDGKVVSRWARYDVKFYQADSLSDSMPTHLDPERLEARCTQEMFAFEQRFCDSRVFTNAV